MYSLFFTLLSLFSLTSPDDLQTAHANKSLPDTNRIQLPVGGNSWILHGKTEQLDEKGLQQWKSPDAILQSYIRFAETGSVHMFLRASAKGKSTIKVSIGGRSKKIQLGDSKNLYDLGNWEVSKVGYIQVSAQGLSRSADEFGTPEAWIFEGKPANEKTAAYVKNSKDNFYYWGRRGPSVHLNYPVPTEENIEWFYNEVTVPEKQDVIGSYFMANGFAEGYFGMQVNSPTERRILFSVWSPFQTDDPKSIPKDKQIVLLKKGKDVYTGEFGNEGSGGQSYLKYNWKAGHTYQFLLQGKPSGDSITTYTAYFFAPEDAEWKLIASFKRPKTQTYLKKLHSFLENFIPEKGNQPRTVYFGNQWIRNVQGKWTELNQAKFSADATARKGYRLDYAGGQEKSVFYLKNCGFFDVFTPIGASFIRESNHKKPEIDLEKLP